ncbi:hypothetical protein HAX54_053000 [Datura stramonium]|uniref:Uncharacterized protein n=1 Tax=Datura stramonium TaxID=4076 RepID=A0ABS8WT23_DATST|nr:hypothetical protein [Datura stramonium]
MKLSYRFEFTFTRYGERRKVGCWKVRRRDGEVLVVVRRREEGEEREEAEGVRPGLVVGFRQKNGGGDLWLDGDESKDVEFQWREEEMVAGRPNFSEDGRREDERRGE